MRWNFKKSDPHFEHEWFAWHPIVIKKASGTMIHYKVIWLQKVLRFRVDVGQMWSEHKWVYNEID